MFPEHNGLLVDMVAVGEGLTNSAIELDAVIQVALDKLATSGPTITR